MCLFSRPFSSTMSEDRDLGPTNPRINRWLEEVETAMIDGTIYGREEEKSVSKKQTECIPVIRTRI